MLGWFHARVLAGGKVRGQEKPSFSKPWKGVNSKKGLVFRKDGVFFLLEENYKYGSASQNKSIKTVGCPNGPGPRV